MQSFPSVPSSVQGSVLPFLVEQISCFFAFPFRFGIILRLFYGNFQAFNDCAIRLMRNYNDGETGKRMHYRDAVKILTVHAYHACVRFFAPGGVHKQHLTALGLSFLEAARFFGGEFRDEAFTGRKKPRHRHDRNLVLSNGTGYKTAMEELLTVKEGIAGRFYMDVDILSAVYRLVADQLRILGEFPRGKHTSAASWNKAWEKAVDETVDRIAQELFCQKKKLGRVYPVCLRESGYLDYAFPLPADDPQYRPPGAYRENWADTMDAEELAVRAAEAAARAASAAAIAAEIGGGGDADADVIVEEETIEIVGDDGVHTELEMTAAESLASLLETSAIESAAYQMPPTRRPSAGGDSGNISTDSEMKEAMGDLSLSAQMSQRLGPAPDVFPNLQQQTAGTSDQQDQAAAPSTQADLNKLRGPGGRSRRFNTAWSDTGEYDHQKASLDKRGRQEKKRSSTQTAGAEKKRTNRSQSRKRASGTDEEKPELKWIPRENEEYPVHYVEKRMHSFINWVELRKLDERCDEVQALRYITDPEPVTRRIISRLHWCMVYGIMKFQHPVPDDIVGLEAVDTRFQYPPTAMFPIQYPPKGDDLREKARMKWERIAAWIQYWFDAQQLMCRPDMFYGGDARLVSPLVYFIFHHINRVLELPMRMKEVLGNTGWARVREHMETFDDNTLAELLDKEEDYRRAANNQNKWTDAAMEARALQNFNLLRDRVKEARKRREAAVRRQQAQKDGEWRRHLEMKQYEADQRAKEQREREEERKREAEREHEREQRHRHHSKTRRETDLERDGRHRRSDKNRQKQSRAAKERAEKPPVRLPPEEKTLTVTLPKPARSAEPIPLRRDTPSSDETSSSARPTSSTGTPVSSDTQSPSPTKTPKDVGTLDEFNELDDVDPLRDLRPHFVPDQDPEPQTETESSYDPRDIEAMEADYEGTPSNREQRRSGQYGETPSYHAVPSPPSQTEREEEELTGPSAATDASPRTEARLLAESPGSAAPTGGETQPPTPPTPVPFSGLEPDTAIMDFNLADLNSNDDGNSNAIDNA